VNALPECRLESLNSCRQVIDAYDAAKDRLAFSSAGRFWNSIRYIHKLGKTGAGRKIAIIDSACDLTHPRLKRVIDRVARFVAPPGGQNLEHGTAVALLISEICPESRLDVYEVVMEEGRVDTNAVRDALAAVAESDAHVVNLSLGIERLQNGEFHPATQSEEFEKAALNPKTWLASKYPDDPSCQLCPAAAAVAVKGKLVFAAAGNAADFVYCPARSPSVVGVGFQEVSVRQVETPDGIGMDSGIERMPSRQSAWLDLTVDEIDGVLGTSFASPLRSGAAALLELTPNSQAECMTCTRLSLVPMLDHLSTHGHGGSLPREFFEAIADKYNKALKVLPHVHCAVGAVLRPDLPPTDPSGCFLCGHMFGDLYLNAGLFCLEQLNFQAAESLLVAAGKLMPYSAEAAANLGATFRLQGKFDDALSLYDEALRLRPAFQNYSRARDVILDDMAKRQPPAWDSQQCVLGVRPDPNFSGFLSAVASTKANSQKQLSQTKREWKLRWQGDCFLACNSTTVENKSDSIKGSTQISETLCVSFDGKALTVSSRPQTMDGLFEVADFMAAVAGSLMWKMVRVKGGEEFRRLFQMCQLRRSLDNKL
jgi:tetratricopeptide (TPR) repeat protein